MGNAFPRSLVPLLAAGLVAAAAPGLDRIADAGGHPAGVPLRATATVEHDGIRYTVTDERAGTKRLVRECAERLCKGTWFDGTRLFAFGINGDSYPAADQDTRNERTLDAITTLRFADPDFAGSVRPAGPNSYTVEANGGTGMLVAIDARTSLPTAASNPDGSSGIVFAPPQRLDGAAVLSEVPLDHLERGDGALAPPQGPQVTFEPALPIRVDPHSRIPIVPCRLESLNLRCVLDTGTTPSSVTLGIAERLGREPDGHILVRSLDTYQTGTIDARPLTIANVTIGQLHYAVVPTTRDRGYDVIVGSDILSAMRLDIDVSDGTVRLSPSGGPVRGTAIPLSFNEGSPYVLATVDGDAQDALFDTGDEALLTIGYDEYRRRMSFPATVSGNVWGMFGGSDTMAGQAPDARIGPLDLGPTRVLIVRSGHVGHVGMGLTARCGELGIDLHQARLDCVPR